ncbi:hypothetical protein EVAR_55669_1 [Eumeta japonica]|uniref:Uncharacterized protein n=1 Tax=Eumeta variegata TaxID=151549 RepID=A0A4C2A0N1_EUMVA|nr:hypothetical protein EVAR_55669_1 [Eumeta japonica]
MFWKVLITSGILEKVATNERPGRKDAISINHRVIAVPGRVAAPSRGNAARSGRRSAHVGVYGRPAITSPDCRGTASHISLLHIRGSALTLPRYSGASLGIDNDRCHPSVTMSATEQ